jgi:hypothetical protein
VVTLSASSLSFGSVNIGQTSTMQGVTLTSSGGLVLSLTFIQVTGTNATDFTEAGTCLSSPTLQPNKSCVITVDFHPSTGAPESASVVYHRQRLRQPAANLPHRHHSRPTPTRPAPSNAIPRRTNASRSAATNRCHSERASCAKDLNLCTKATFPWPSYDRVSNPELRLSNFEFRSSRLYNALNVALLFYALTTLSGCAASVGRSAAQPALTATPSGAYTITVTPTATCAATSKQFQLSPIGLSLTVN